MSNDDVPATPAPDASAHSGGDLDSHFLEDLYIAVMPDEAKDGAGREVFTPSDVKTYKIYHIKVAQYQKKEYEVSPCDLPPRVKMLIENGANLAAIPYDANGAYPDTCICYLVNLASLKSRNPGEKKA